jgi:hypothetical protein
MSIADILKLEKMSWDIAVLGEKKDQLVICQTAGIFTLLALQLIHGWVLNSTANEKIVWVCLLVIWGLACVSYSFYLFLKMQQLRKEFDGLIGK